MTWGDAGPFRRLFPRRYTPLVLSAILQVSGSLQKESETEREESITERLHAQIIRIHPFRDGPLDIQQEPKVKYHDKSGRLMTGKLDLRVSCSLGYLVCFVIEAKRMRVRSTKGRLAAGNSAYVNSGMMRFITGKYAPFMASSAMLGYVFDGQTAKSRSGIDKYIQKKAEELKLKNPVQLTKSDILPGKLVDETKHDLGDREFIIYHILLSVE